MELLSPVIFLPFFIFFLLSLILLSCYPFCDKRAKKCGSTAPKSMSWLSSVLETVKNGHRFLDWTMEILEASPTKTVTTFIAVFTANPSNVEHMLKTKFDNYPKGESFMDTFGDFLGRGIFNSDGEVWKLQRRTASLQFSTRLMRGFTMDNIHFVVYQRLIPLLKKAAAEGETLDLQDVLDRLAFDNVCKVAFDVDPEYLGGGAEEGREFAHAFDEAMTLVSERFRTPPFFWKLKRLFNVSGERRLRAAIAIVHSFAEKVVKSRKIALLSSGSGSASKTNDLLSRFVADDYFDDGILRDVTVSFILAGRDTTSSAMTWFFWILTYRRDVEQKVLEEVRSVRRRHGNSDDVLTLEQLKELEYLHAALSETLRLYPVVPLETRSCLEDDVMPDGTFVRKGSIVMYSSYAMGRSEAIWGEDCREFKPERWLENGAFQPKNPFKFPVFHAGPRMCLGKDMAYTQMKSVVVSVLEMFEMEVAEEEKVREHLFTTVLRMKGGFPVQMKERRVQ